MRFVVSSIRMRGLNQAAVIAILAIIGTGCSSDFARFEAAEYSASIVDKQAQVQQENPYPAGVDPVTTASISRPNVNRPPLPGGNINGSTAPQLAQKQYESPANYASAPVVRAKPANNYNTYNTYNTYQTSAAKVSKPVQLAPIKNGATRTPAYVDPITTSSLKPARAAKVKQVAEIKNVVQKPVTEHVGTQPSGWTAIGGSSIAVRDGETLYNISKRYGVPVSELKKANKINNVDQVVAGQRIVIPTYVYSANAPISAPDNNPKTRAARATRGMIGEVSQDNIIVPTKSPSGYKPGLAPMSVTRNSNSTLSGNASSYTVASGDTLGSIAGAQGIRLSDLMQANALSGSSIRVGQKLIIPGKSAGQSVKKTVEQTVDRRVTGSTPKPYVKPGVTSPARPSSIDEKAPARTGIETFRWPATGKVTSKFGDRRRGQRNDGIDILVPEGTSVKAAENGVVIYSDSELQEYGNLLLIRHTGGWVSAYAHNKTLKVKRGDKVRRGQVIAKSGRTGNAERPMVHFQLRKDANPVNPQKFLR